MKKQLKKGILAFIIIAIVFVVLPDTVFADTLDTTLDFTSATQDMSGDGYNWTQEDKTLTLQNLELYVASGKGIVLPDGASLVLKGENHITTDAGTMIEAKGSLKIDGGGSLIGYSNGKSDDYYGIATGGGDLQIGNCKLDLHIKPEFVTEVISTVKDNQDIGGAMTFKKGADVTVGDDPAEGEIYRSWGVCTGKYGSKNKKCGDLTIEEGATLKVHGLLGFFVSYGSNVTISGTLDTTGCMDEDSVVAANVLTRDNVKVDGTLKLLANQYLDTRGTNLTIAAKAGSTGSVFNPDMLSAWVYSDKRGFNKSWSTWINRKGLKKLHIAKGAVFTVIPTGEIKEPDYYGGYDIINQTLKLAPDSLADLSGGGYVQVEKDGVVELNLEGATVEEVKKLNMFCGKVNVNGTEATMHTGGKATCKGPAVCDVCRTGYGERNSDNHESSVEWIQTKTEHTKKYSCCGEIVVATEKHEWKDGKCDKCDYKCVHAGGEGNCQKAAVCTICGESYGECDPNTHTGTAEWVQTETEHTQKYTCCGKEVVATEKHEWKDGRCETCNYMCQHTGGTATCLNKAVCSICGEEYGDADPDNHTGTAEWVQTETEHTQKYTCCGKEVVATEKHEWKDGRCETCNYVCVHTGGTATCLNKAVCAFCGEEYGSVNSNNHTKTVEWVQTKTEHMKKYTCCGKVVAATEKHQWKDGRCTTCNYVCKHTGGTATCSNRAVCMYCGDEYGELNSQNHGILKHVPAKPATKHTDGNIEYWCCENCHRYYSDAMAFKEIKKKAIKIAAKKKNAEQQKTGTTKKKINTSTKANTKTKGKTKTNTNTRANTKTKGKTNTKANTEGNTKTSSGATANTGTSESPDTGDQNNPALAFALMSVSGVILLGLVIVERRRRKANGSL